MPRLVFSGRRVLGLSRFSLGMMGSEIANFITFQSPMVIISRYLGLSDAGAYSAANRFSSIPNQVVLSAVMGVLFPAFSRMGDDKERRSQALMFSTQVTTVLLAPMMFGLWALAEPAMRVLFGSQWAYAWPVLGLLALSKGILTPCSTFIPYLKGVGHGRALFSSAVVRAVATCAAVGYGASTGTLVDAMIWLCAVNAVTLVGYSWAVFRADGTPFSKGFLTICRPMVLALVMALAVRLLLQAFGSSRAERRAAGRHWRRSWRPRLCASGARLRAPIAEENLSIWSKRPQDRKAGTVSGRMTFRIKATAAARSPYFGMKPAEQAANRKPLTNECGYFRIIFACPSKMRLRDVYACMRTSSVTPSCDSAFPSLARSAVPAVARHSWPRPVCCIAT